MAKVVDDSARSTGVRVAQRESTALLVSESSAKRSESSSSGFATSFFTLARPGSGWTMTDEGGGALCLRTESNCQGY